MDSTDQEIVFDAQGFCNHCSEFLSKKIYWTYQGESSDKILQQRVRKIKKEGRGKQYDCVAGISGGADSCYVAQVCKNLGLRVLLVHVDNGWNSAKSVKNIEIICRKLDFDLKTYVLDWDDFREVQLSHLKASVPEIETPTDIAILEYLHKAAAQYNIKHIIMGGNYITEGILPSSWHYNAKDKTYSKAIHKKFGAKKIKQFPAFDFWMESYYKFIKGIDIFYILNYLPYSKESARKVLDEMGWNDYGQKHHESFYTRIVQSYILPLKFNIDYRKPTLSTGICNGTVSREDALRQLKQKPYDECTIQNDIEYVCKKLNISVKEFNVILSSEPKSFRAYPNQSRKLEFLYKLYRFIKNSQTK